MPNNPATEEQVPLERVEIHFEHDWSKLAKVIIKAKNVEEPKTWPDDDKKFNPEKTPGFIAFLLACVSAARKGMPTGKEVLAGSPANTFFSLHKGIANAAGTWRANWLFFPACVEPVFKGVLQAKHNPKTKIFRVDLIQPFDVIARTDGQDSDFSKAENALKELYLLASKILKPSPDALIPLPSKPHRLPPIRCHKWIPRPAVEKSLREALTSQKPVVWVYGEEGVGKAEVVRHVLDELYPTLALGLH